MGLEAKSVSLKTRKYMEMNVENFLACGLAICQE